MTDQRLWVSLAGHGRRLTVLSGVARLAGTGELSMTGFSPVVRERRRSAPRVGLADGSQVTLGEHVAVRLDLDDGDAVSADGVVVRVEEADGYAVVRFDRLPRLIRWPRPG